MAHGSWARAGGALVGAVVGTILAGVGGSIVLAAVGFLAGGDEGFGDVGTRRAEMLLLVATAAGALAAGAVGALLVGAALRHRHGPGRGGAPPR